MKKHILITGSTDGIGKLVAERLAKEGHTIYLHGRSQNKLDNVIAEVKEQSKNTKIKGFMADFADFDSIKQMIYFVKREVPKIDVLINNAGVFNSSVAENKAGLDIRYMVNYFAPYLLTNQLLPLLESGTNARIINVSSAAQSSISYPVFYGQQKVSESEAYAQSKLALTMWSFDLAKTLSDITVVAVNPGSLLNTKMAIEAFGNYWSPADKGANILYELAVCEEYKGVTGVYFDNDQGSFGLAHQDAYDNLLLQKLVEKTDTITLG